MSRIRFLVGLGPAVIVSFALALFTTAAAQFDVSRYRPRPLRDVVAEFPASSGVSISQDIPVRARVAYSGDFRPLSHDSRRVMEAWAKSMDFPDMVQRFTQEVHVREAATEYWLPVQEVLVPTMRGELRRGETIEVFVIYIGQVDGRHVLLVNAFDHEGPHRPGPRPGT